MMVFFLATLLAFDLNLPEFMIKTISISQGKFIDAPLEPDMKKSLEIYQMKNLSLASTRFIMEMGI